MVRLWGTQRGEPVAVRKGHREQVQALAFAPDGVSLASAARGGEVKMWNVEGGSWEHPMLQCGSDWVPAAVFFPDGTRLACAYKGDEIAIWDVRDPSAASPPPAFHRTLFRRHLWPCNGRPRG
jgi:WD40 repeat protein